jgi:iron complex outermembrane recepter protein
MACLRRLAAGWLLGSVLAAVTWAAPSEAIRSLSADIPTESLSDALTALSDQTGLQLVYVSSLAEGKLSHPAAAGLSARVALARMLEGTGLDFDFLNSRTVKLHEARGSAARHARPAVAAPRAAVPSTLAELEEIVVTATKREELLRDVPVSATVLTGEVLNETGVTDIGMIAALSPGVEYDFNAQWGGGVLTNIAIRGIDSKVGTSTTGVYIDDSAIQARNGNFGNPYPVIFDLDRVEILRGPQGTLFGAGAEGGAVRFITNEPSTTVASSLVHSEFASTEYGGLSYEAAAAAGAPLIPGELGVRASAYYRVDGGYVDRVDPFSAAPVERASNQARALAFRLALAAEPAPTLRIVPSIAYQSSTLGDSPSFYQSLSDPSAGQFLNGKLISQPSDDSFLLSSLKLEARLAAANLTAVTSYLDREAHATIDTTNEAGAVFFGGFGNPLGPAFPVSYADAVPTLTTLRQFALSQELRLVSADGDARVKWAGGLFYSRSRQDETLYTYLIADPGTAAINSSQDYTDSLAAAFGTIDVRLLPRLRMSLGVRVDDVRSDYSQTAGGFADAGVPSFARGGAAQRPVAPQFNLQYRDSGSNLLYATVAKGFRVGGINTPLPSQCGGIGVPLSYTGDSLWSYEIGTKRRAFDDRLQLAASAFYLRWGDIQENEVPSCGFGYIANVGRATGKGLDLAFDAALTEHLTFGLAAESVDVRYGDTVTLDGLLIVERGAVVGGVPHVPPPWSGTAYLRYQRSIGADLALFARAQDIVRSHNPGPFSELNPKSISYSPGYTADPATNLLDLQIGIVRSHWDLRLFMNNALDSTPVLQRNADAPGSTLVYAYTFRPRTTGIAGSWKF